MALGKRGKPQPRYWEKGHLSFSGGGFIGIYHVGVVLAFKEFAPHIASRKALGASSGALATTCVVAGLPLYQAISTITEMAVHCRSLSLGPLNPRFNIADIMRAGLENHLPEDAAERCSGRMYISATRASTFRGEVFSEFRSRKELVDVLMSSCFIPYFLGLVPPKVRGASYIDGGFTDNLPTHDENTISVSPFAGLACIRPRPTNPHLPDIIYTPENAVRMVKTMFAPRPRALEELCQQGYADALRFIVKHDLIACLTCARLPHRPRRGDCAMCAGLLEASKVAKMPPHLLRPLEEADAVEQAQAEADPFQHTPLMRIVNVVTAMAYLPVDASVAVVLKTYRCWDDITDAIKRSLQNGYIGLWNYARKLILMSPHADVCGGPDGF